MDQQNLSAPTSAQVSPARRLIAAGFIRHLAGRTISVRATEAGVTGTIKVARLAELHRLCREDYTSSADRRAQNHRDDASLLARASQAVAAR